MITGHCSRCGRRHVLESRAARAAAGELMACLGTHRRLDFDVPAALADPGLATAWLFGPARGKMFGVLLCRDRLGGEVLLRGFSGQYNGRWSVPGWVGPLFDPAAFAHLTGPVDRRIKKLDRRVAAGDGERSRAAAAVRRRLSRRLTRDIQQLYRLYNFHGETATLQQAFGRRGGIPTGTGDCCAPKLLNHAAREGLVPLALSEFYWGRANRSATCGHGRFYLPCDSKCAPLLGWLLCGLEERQGA